MESPDLRTPTGSPSEGYVIFRHFEARSLNIMGHCRTTVFGSFTLSMKTQPDLRDPH